MGHAALWQKSIGDSLREWLQGEQSWDQGDFWKLFSTLRAKEINPSHLANILDLNFSTEGPATWVQMAPGCGKSTFLAQHFGDTWQAANEQRLDFKLIAFSDDFAVVDGQHRLFALTKIQRNVSSRVVKRALQSTLSAIENCSSFNSVTDLFDLLGSSLSQSLCGKVRLSFYYFYDVSDELSIETTRDAIMNFRIRTGNPPPTGCRTWAVVSCPRATTIVVRKKDEKVQKSKGARRLRESLRARRPRSHLSQCPQKDARAQGSAQFARCGHPWPHRLLAEGTWRTWARARWKMAHSVSVE
jgi:hypothetical protein